MYTTKAQVYVHNFDTAPITYPYTAAPLSANPAITGSTWTNSRGNWLSSTGATGQAILVETVVGSTTPTTTITLNFNVATGKLLDITSFNFWRRRTPSAAPNWSMAINGTTVYNNSSIPTTGSAIGQTNVAAPVTGLTGTVTVTFTLNNNATGAGTVYLDDFTLYGTISDAPCTQAPSVSSFIPTSGPAGTLVTFTGTGFEDGVTSVKFNGVEAAGFTVVSDTELKALVPVGTSTGPISVSTGASCNGVSATPFTFFATDCPPAPQEIYISEIYDKLGGTPGAIELYNPSGSPVNLNGYRLLRYGEIGDPQNAPSFYNMILSGTIGPEDTFLVTINMNNSDTCNIIGDFDLENGINENDEFELLKNNVVIDNVEIPLGTGQTSGRGYTLIRKPGAIAPKAAFDVNDWNVFGDENCADLGQHLADPITLPPPGEITQQPVSESVCEDETATFTVQIDGTGFTYQWKFLNDSGNWVNVSGANYAGGNTATLTVNAALELNNTQYYCEIVSGDCTLITEAVQLTVSPLPIVAVATTFDCTLNLGGFTITPSIGTGLTYSINGGMTFSANTIYTGLIEAEYTLIIRSATGCETIMPVTIQGPVLTATTQDETCNALGSLTVTSPMGGTYTYSINGGTPQSTPEFTGLAADTYTVTVDDGVGCVLTETYTINGPATVVVTADLEDETCGGLGSITVTNPTGATYTYTLNGGAPQASPIFENLSADTYTIVADNGSGCTYTETFTINAAPTPPVLLADVVDEVCGALGSITVTQPTGGTYTYAINGGTPQASPVFGNLAADTYTVTADNGSGCISTETFTVNPAPAAPVLLADVVDEVCGALGSITVTQPTGGTYTYTINGGTPQASPVFGNLAADTYTVTADNGSGCISTETFTVNPAPAAPVLLADVVDEVCGALGSITVTQPTGGAYTYTINGGTPQASPVFGNLAADTYTVTADNGSGCISTETFTVNPAPAAPALLANVADVTCSAQGSITVTQPTGGTYTYSINGGTPQASPVFNGLAADTYTITADNGSGCISTETFTVNPAPAVNVIADEQDVTCTSLGSITVQSPVGNTYTYTINGGTPQNSPVFNGLTADSYTIVATDGTCTYTGTFTINAAPVLPALLADVENATCSAAGSLTVTQPVTGGTFMYSLDGGTPQASAEFTGLTAGTYTLTAEDANGCTTSATFTITGSTGTLPSVTGIQECRDTPSGKNYILEALPVNNSFDGTATFVWEDASGNVLPGSESTFNVTQYVANNNFDADDYPLTIRVTVTNAGGCEGTYDFTVDGVICSIPRGISPNNDAKNDSFDLTGLNARKLIIFNRYGKEVYSRNNYTKEWHGQSDNGDELPTGTYYYMIETVGKPRTGWIYVNREE
ncbi:gliding motility-associated C-terminal domain-containing protein [Flavobacterium sp. MK4S-17]|uniref:T9SS type B sorting domain-containing protein n=1 Tax=Flavobacterium sp. MK4S-17 TaxID=2543737 RepID=UPI001356FB72|nr:gliding motility-associated C-terminal domain-containing protein [Flavobacterium sp. MK4S-17]